MKWIFLMAVVFYLAHAKAQGTVVKPVQSDELHGYKKLFYKLVILHPKINSPAERNLLKHYLAGTGTPYFFSEAEFKLLKITVSNFQTQKNCTALQQAGYCTRQTVLDEDDFFGWALGTITCVYSTLTGEMISFADVYDFNKKPKGKRKLKSEMATRIFRLLAPRSAKSFIVCYGDAAYFTFQ